MASNALNYAILFVLLCVNFCKAEDLQVGTSVGSEIAYVEQVKLSAIPLKTRTKNVFYSDETNRIIKGISALDLDKKNAKAIVTSGGVGSSFANIRLKSDRGNGLNYQVQIFV